MNDSLIYILLIAGIFTLAAMVGQSEARNCNHGSPVSEIKL